MKALEGFDDLLALGKVSHPVKIGSHEVRLHTLNSLEYGKMTRSAGDAPESTTAERFEILQRWTLSYAIESIDGKAVTPEQANEILSGAQLAVSNSLYDAYVVMVSEQNKLLDDAKKNSSEVAIS